MLNLFKKHDVSTMTDLDLQRLSVWGRKDLDTKSITERGRKEIWANVEAADAELDRRRGK